MTVKYIRTPADARKFLRGAGTKVAVQIGYSTNYFFAEKGDFIESVLNNPSFIDCDGHELTEQVYYWEGFKVLHFPSGTGVGVAS
jgi:hypothetical protein